MAPEYFFFALCLQLINLCLYLLRRCLRKHLLCTSRRSLRMLRPYVISESCPHAI
jgi:hypothetical protein